MGDESFINQFFKKGNETPSASPPPAEKSTSGQSPSLVATIPSATIHPPTIEYLLQLTAQKGASDLHLSGHRPPSLRINGDLQPLDSPALLGEQIQEIVQPILAPHLKKKLDNSNELDFAYELKGFSRFRVNIFRNVHGMAAVFRVIPSKIPTLADLGLPKTLEDLTHRTRGLILVTGPTGSGKSTTLAGMVDAINSTRNEHILTIEDPVEFMHPHKKCLVNQREIGPNTASFADALRSALREDPNIILVGEMRDFETISLAITAAETGHLVFGTLHTPSAAQSIDRIIDVFPSHQQSQIRTQLAESLVAILSQQLVPLKNGRGRALAMEILLVNTAVSNLIREQKTFQILSVIQTGKSQGMITMDQSLEELLKKGLIDPLEASKRAADKKAFEHYLEKK